MVLVLLSACTSADTADSYVALDVSGLMDPATCQECHPDHYDQWQGSMHAYAAADPIFRAMNARGQRLDIEVLPESGTGELVGISGTLTIEVVDRVHHYDLAYELPPAP